MSEFRILGTCPICNGSNTVSQRNDLSEFSHCKSCGLLKITPSFLDGFDLDKLAIYLYYNGKINKPIQDERFFNFIGSEMGFSREFVEYPWCYHVTPAVVDNWYPKNFTEKIDIVLLGLWKINEYMGQEISLTKSELYSATFVARRKNGMLRDDFELEEQAEFMLDYLSTQGYADVSPTHNIELKASAYQRVDELQKNIEQTSKTVFVAMSFASEMNDVREAIKVAVTNAGYIPVLMDEVEHNHQIVPEMLYEIRKSKFVIAELTGHNNGAYFESGYALGLGKVVIQVCRKDKFSEDGHFDVKQVSTVLWDKTDDLIVALEKRIRASI
ncbi:MAG: DUF4062 domain-containing protein [Eubacteriales bacterium]|nr:DUF4062 domain-containing protein [Eubacteriales bacterium]